jgi:hypothetical protein
MKWCILLLLLSFSVEKQKKIIIACMALHNFIHDSDLSDQLFEMCDNDEEFPPVEASEGGAYNGAAADDEDMCAFRDFIADSLIADRG